MHDFGFLPANTHADVQYFSANSATVGAKWDTWYRPRGDLMVMIILVGSGGGGGNSVLGAASTAAGGGGGGSGGVTILTIPACFLPDELYISLAIANAGNASTSAAAGFASYVAIMHTSGAPVANNVIAIANSGASGGASTGATAGPVGTAGAVATIATMPLGGMGQYILTAGQVGIIGGTTVAGAALTLPLTGLFCTGGTGGGGLPAISTGGSAGGLITGVAGFMPVPVSIPGGVGGTTAPTSGSPGITSATPLWRGMPYSVGGTGGGSSGLGASTGASGGNGGFGGLGSGGGGAGGGFTGGTAAIGGRGGNAYCYIISW